MNQDQWVEAGQHILAQATTLLRPWGLEPESGLQVRADTHPCPGYIVSEKCIVFCPPVMDTRVQKLRWLMHRSVMGCETLDEVVRFYEVGLPYIICHELVHHLRFKAEFASPSMFVEEEACDQVCVAMLDAFPEWNAQSDALRTACTQMSARLATKSHTERTYLPSTGDVMVLAERLSRDELNELEELATESGITADEMLSIAGGEDGSAFQTARNSRARANEYLDSRYTDDTATYWALKLAWLAAWLGRPSRPELPEMLRKHLLPRAINSGDTEVAGALRTLMLSEAAATAVASASTMGTRAAAAEGYLSLVGPTGLTSLVEAGLKTKRPAKLARVALRLRLATSANREVLRPLAEACLANATELDQESLVIGLQLAVGISSLDLVKAVIDHLIDNETRRAIRLATTPEVQDTMLPESTESRETFLMTWRLAERAWSEMPDTWRKSLMATESRPAQEELLGLLAASDENGDDAVRLALRTRLLDGTPALLAQADKVLARSPNMVSKLLIEMLPLRGTPAWEQALKLCTSIGLSGKLPDTLECHIFQSDLDGTNPPENPSVEPQAETVADSVSRILWGANKFAEKSEGDAHSGNLACAALLDLARLRTLDLIALLVPIESAAGIRKIQNGLRPRAHLSEPILDILTSNLPSGFRLRVRSLLHGVPGDTPPRTEDLPDVLVQVLGGIEQYDNGRIHDWLAKLDLSEDKALLNAVEKMVHLRSVPMFEDLGIESLKALADRSLEQKYEQGDVIVTEGEPGSRLYIMLTGRAEVSQARTEGPIVLGVMGPRQVFGEMTLLDDSPRSATVRALSACRVLTLSRDDLRPVAHRNPEVYEELLIALSAKLRAANTRDLNANV